MSAQDTTDQSFYQIAHKIWTLLIVGKLERKPPISAHIGDKHFVGFVSLGQLNNTRHF
jgi:hypothetical protein